MFCTFSHKSFQSWHLFFSDKFLKQAHLNHMHIHRVSVQRQIQQTSMWFYPDRFTRTACYVRYLSSGFLFHFPKKCFSRIVVRISLDRQSHLIAIFWRQPLLTILTSTSHSSKYAILTYIFKRAKCTWINGIKFLYGLEKKSWAVARLNHIREDVKCCDVFHWQFLSNESQFYPLFSNDIRAINFIFIDFKFIFESRFIRFFCASICMLNHSQEYFYMSWCFCSLGIISMIMAVNDVNDYIFRSCLSYFWLCYRILRLLKD